MSNNSFWRWRRPTFDTTSRPESPNILSGAAEALTSIFGDDEVSDIKLQGNDGGTVVAVKAILASRSPMFRQKFFGESRSFFIPTKPGDIELVIFEDWDCRVLHLVVEYCYTDSCSVMKCQPTEDIARLMATLRVASKVFKLPGLLEKIQQWVWRQVSRHPGLACAMIDEGMRNDDVDELALQTLQLKARASLLPHQNSVGSGVLALTKPGLLFILRTLEETTSHSLLLHVIEQWVDFSSEGCSGDHPDRERASREAFGRKCAMRFIKLSKLPQENLDSLLKRSKLFMNADGTMAPIVQPSANFSTRRSFSPTNTSPMNSKSLTNPTTSYRNLNINSDPTRSLSPNRHLDTLRENSPSMSPRSHTMSQ